MRKRKYEQFTKIYRQLKLKSEEDTAGLLNIKRNSGINFWFDAFGLTVLR